MTDAGTVAPIAGGEALEVGAAADVRGAKPVAGGALDGADAPGAEVPGTGEAGEDPAADGLPLGMDDWWLAPAAPGLEVELEAHPASSAAAATAVRGNTSFVIPM